MLTLADSVRVGAYTLYRDVVFEGGKRTLTNNFYMLPDAPRVSTDDSGGPAIHFLMYRQLDSSGAQPKVSGGGLFTITVQVTPNADEQAKIKAGLAQQINVDPNDVKLQHIPFQSGTVTLSFAADSSDLVGKPAGTAPAALVGDEKMSFALEVTADGASVLYDTLQKNLSLLLVRYDLAFEYRLDGLKVQVFCDTHRAYSQATAQQLGGKIDLQVLTQTLISQQAAGVTVTSDMPIPPDQNNSLVELGTKILQDAIGSALFNPNSSSSSSSASSSSSSMSAALGSSTDASSTTTTGDDGLTLKPPSQIDESLDGQLNFSLTQSYPAIQHSAIQTFLTFNMTPAQFAERVTVLDVSDSMRPFEVTAVCPVDFDNGLVSVVHVYIDYNGTQDDYAFRSKSDTQHLFRAMAAPDVKDYRYKCTVYYKDGTNAELDWSHTTETILVLDVDRLGILDVAIELGYVAFDAVRSVVVDIECPDKNLTHELVLDATHASDRWTAVVGTLTPGTVRYKTAWITTDNRRLEQDWAPVQGNQIFLSMPHGVLSTQTVLLIASGDFSDIAQLVLELRTGDEDDQKFIFKKAGDQQTWQPRLNGQPLHYQQRQTVVTQDGVARQTDWVDNDAPINVVHDLFSFTVLVVPRLLGLGGANTIALFSLQYDDAQTNLHQSGSLVFRAGATEQPVRFRIGSPDRHQYRYQLTLVDNQNQRHVADWTNADTEVLVLHSPDGDGG